jgi:hypothetical protein
MKYRECLKSSGVFPWKTSRLLIAPLPGGGAIIDACRFLDSTLRTVSSAV